MPPQVWLRRAIQRPRLWPPERTQNPVPIAIGLHHNHRFYTLIAGSEQAATLARNAAKSTSARSGRVDASDRGGWPQLAGHRFLARCSRRPNVLVPMARANSCGSQHARMGSSRDRLNGGPELTAFRCASKPAASSAAQTPPRTSPGTCLRRPGSHPGTATSTGPPLGAATSCRHLSAAPWRQSARRRRTAATGSSSTQLRPIEQAGQLARMWSQQPARRSRLRQIAEPIGVDDRRAVSFATRWSTSAPSVRSPQPEPNRWA